MIGIIGGSGVYHLDGLTDTHWEKVSSPFGSPSDDLLFGRFNGHPIVFCYGMDAIIVFHRTVSITAPISTHSKERVSPISCRSVQSARSTNGSLPALLS